jgi:hypothetical protein
LSARLEEQLCIRLDSVEVEAIGPAIRARTLVVHDEGDDEVPFGDGERVAARIRGGRLHTTRGLGHRKILRDESVIAVVTQFLTGHAPPEDVPALVDPIERELFDPDARR